MEVPSRHSGRAMGSMPSFRIASAAVKLPEKAPSIFSAVKLSMMFPYRERRVKRIFRPVCCRM